MACWCRVAPTQAHLVAVKDALVILGRRKRRDGVAIAEGENAALFAHQQLLDDHLCSSTPKRLVQHNGAQSLNRLGRALGQQHAFSRSQTTCLDHDAVLCRLDVSTGVSKVREDLKMDIEAASSADHAWTHSTHTR